MNILYLLKSKPNATTNEMIANHQESSQVTVIDLRENKNYEDIIDQVFKNDKVICC